MDEEQPKRLIRAPRKTSSTTGGAGVRVVDQSNWRTRMRENRIKFDDNLKEEFLQEIAKNCRITHACQKIGITPFTYRQHLEKDPDFAEAFEDAKRTYRDRLHEHAENLMFEGVNRPVIGGRNKDEVVATYKEYPIPLIMMELKKVDPEYKDRQEVNMKSLNGVVVVPADMSADDWVKEQEAKNSQRTRPDENDPLK
jgi:hypothetical protein